MTSVPLTAEQSTDGHSRPLNILRDLPRVADLMELCFDNIDNEGKAYIQQMRRTGRDASFLLKARNSLVGPSIPFSGFVWEQDKRIVGNASLVNFLYKGRRIYLIANVATHPDYRRRGIATSLTKKIMQHACRRGVQAIWLHVRADNPGALKLYSDLGFEERARRTTWMIRKNSSTLPPPLDRSDRPDGLPTVTRRHPRFWPQQLAWLKKLHPEELNWYWHVSWRNLQPGLWNWAYRTFIEMDLHQWAVQKDDQLQGTLAWIPSSRSSLLWLACDPDASTESITRMLQQARRDLSYRQYIKLEHPAGLQDEAIRAAGFDFYRTLIWMHMDCAT